MMGATKRFYDRINATLTSGGSGNAQTLVYTVAPTALVKGDTYSFIAGFTNTGAATLNVGVGGAVPIRVGASALSPGSITAGDAVQVMYDGTNFQFTGWDPSRPTGQDLVVNTLNATASGLAIVASAGSLSVAGNITAAGNISGANLFLSSTFIGLNGNTSLSQGPFLNANNTDVAIRIGSGAGSLFIQNNAGASDHVFGATGNASHAGTLFVGGATTLNSTLSVGSNASIGTSLSVGSTLTVGSTATVSGALNVTGDIATAGNLSVGGGAIGMAGYTVFTSNPINAGYVVINDNAQRGSIFLGSGDPTNYHRQTTHLFQSQAGGATYLQLTPGLFHSYVNATFDGTLTTGGEIVSNNNSIVSNGSNAALGFADRGGGVQWLWYSSSNIARLWENVQGDRVTVDTNGSLNATGNLSCAGNLTTTSYVNSLDNVYTHGVGVIYQNIGSNGFNFRWDGAHIFGRVDNAVEYPLYNANGGTISGNLVTTGSITANATINTVSYYTSGALAMDTGGGFLRLWDSGGTPSIFCGASNTYIKNVNIRFDDYSGNSLALMTLGGVTINPPLTANGGIGTTSLLATGTVTANSVVNTTTYQTNGHTLANQDGTYNVIYRLDGAQGLYLGNNGNNFFRNTQLNFDDGGTTFMTMTSGGNISFVPLVVVNNVAIAARESGGTARNVALMNGSNQLIFGNTTTSVVVINSGGDCTVTATGNFVVSNNDAYKPGGGSWQAISDVRVKEDVRDYEVGLEALKLRPVTYKLNGKGGTVADGREYVGLVADEVEPVMAEMVGRLDDDELGEVKTLNTNALTYALLNVCKRLEARLAALEAK